MSASYLLQSAVDALALGSLYALFALGIALIFGILGLINFAHSELVMAGAYALVLLSDVSVPIKIAAAVLVVVALAVVMERVAFRPVRGADAATMLITSFAVSYLLQNLAILIFGAEPRSGVVAAGLSDTVRVGDVQFSVLSIVTIVGTAVLLTALGLFLTRTPLGLQMRAAAEDFRTARLLGVRTNRVIAAAFVGSGLLAAVAAVILTAQTGLVTSAIGVNVVLLAFVATILGGLGTLGGAVLGGLLLGITSVVLQVVLPLELRPFRDAFLFVAVFAVLVLRPQGLIVTRAVRGRV